MHSNEIRNRINMPNTTLNFMVIPILLARKNYSFEKEFPKLLEETGGGRMYMT